LARLVGATKSIAGKRATAAQAGRVARKARSVEKREPTAEEVLALRYIVDALMAGSSGRQ
jgi:hypothetical protein